jgi:hypothetical protein
LFWGCGLQNFIQLLFGLSVPIFFCQRHKKSISTSIPQPFISKSFFIFYYAIDLRYFLLRTYGTLLKHALFVLQMGSAYGTEMQKQSNQL